MGGFNEKTSDHYGMVRDIFSDLRTSNLDLKKISRQPDSVFITDQTVINSKDWALLLTTIANS